MPKSTAEALKWYSKAAEQGLAQAQLVLGMVYARGEGVAPDLAEAADWYHPAAAQGHVTAQIELASMYATGEGVQKDLVSAYMWANLAAAQGDEWARDFRQQLSEKMSPEQISEAERRALEMAPSE